MNKSENLVNNRGFHRLLLLYSAIIIYENWDSSLVNEHHLLTEQAVIQKAIYKLPLAQCSTTAKILARGKQNQQIHVS